MLTIKTLKNRKLNMFFVFVLVNMFALELIISLEHFGKYLLRRRC